MDYRRFTVDDFLLDDSFLAYCLGTDPKASAVWRQWLQTKPSNEAAFREAERMCRLLNAEKPALDASLAELEMLIAAQTAAQQPIYTPQQLVTTTDVPVISMPTAQPRTWGVNRWAVAATVLLASLFGLLGYRYWSDQYVVYETAYNQQRTITLPDGSTVRLNSHSVLKHRRNGLSGQIREVEVDGEAFFAVRHTATDAPFRVILPGTFDVQVLGTEFTVNHRGGPRMAGLERVVLSSGQVRVDFHDRRPALTLAPGQMVEVRSGVADPQPQSVKPDTYLAWMKQQFVFDNTTLIDAAQQIESQFGVSVELAGDAIAQRRFSGILPISTPNATLTALAELNKLTVRKEGNGFVLGE